MATYVDILKSEFPEIDSELFDYITGERPGTEPLSTGPEHDDHTWPPPPCSPASCGSLAAELTS